MRGRLRIDVAKCQAQIVFIDDIGGNFAPDDFAEYCAQDFFLMVSAFQITAGLRLQSWFPKSNRAQQRTLI
jgi:hypothetical protein